MHFQESKWATLNFPPIDESSFRPDWVEHTPQPDVFTRATSFNPDNNVEEQQQMLICIQ